MKDILNLLVEGQDISTQETTEFFNQVMSGNVAPELLASVLTALKIKGESSEEIAGAAVAVRSHATPFPLVNFPVADCVGTGGDGANTINISTTAAILAAACGLKIAKHGNRSVSSMSGSADLLEAMGVNLMMSPEVAATCLAQTNFCFLYAPAYHPGFKYAGPVRKAMGIRTLFNILGPLVNPSAPKTMLLGVYTPELIDTMAQALMLTGVEKGWVVHGSGLDEIALHGTTEIAEISNGTITRKQVSPSDFGLDTFTLEDIKGGTPQENAAYIDAILNGEGQAAHQAAVIINCAALLYLHGNADSLVSAADIAKQTLNSGLAAKTLAEFAALSNSKAEG